MIPPIAASRLSPQLREEARAAFGRVVPLWPYFLALDLLLLLMWAYPDVFIPAVEINRPRFNPAQLYSLSFFFLLLWLPVWFARMPDLWRSYVKPRLARPSMWALLAACIAAAALAFDSTHPWNQESRYIRNWPLYAMQHSRPGRIAGAAAAVASLLLVWRLTVQQPRAGELGLVWLFTLGYLAPHWLADPRYYIVTFLFLHLLVRFSPTQERVLLVWYTVLNAGVCVYILARGSPAGGIW